MEWMTKIKNKITPFGNGISSFILIPKTSPVRVSQPYIKHAIGVLGLFFKCQGTVYI